MAIHHKISKIDELYTIAETMIQYFIQYQIL